MTILLTGGAGFIGAATAERLLGRGERVTVLDNFNDYYPVRLKRDRIARLARFEEALTEPLMRLIGLIEEACGKKAVIDFHPMQPGDVARTYADIDAIRGDLAYQPTTPIDVGIPAFVEWFRSYTGR